VRELQNLCERAVVLSAGETIEPGLIRAWFAGAPAAPAPAPEAPRSEASRFGKAQPLGAGRANGEGTRSPSVHVNPIEVAPFVAGEPRPLSEIEREVIVETLHRFNGHRQKTARALGIGVRTLGLKLKKWKEQNLVAEGL